MKTTFDMMFIQHGITIMKTGWVQLGDGGSCLPGLLAAT